MSDELDILRTTRATVDPPSAAARRAARARWDTDTLAIVAAIAWSRPGNGARGSRRPNADCRRCRGRADGQRVVVTRERITSVKPKHTGRGQLARRGGRPRTTSVPPRRKRLPSRSSQRDGRSFGGRPDFERRSDTIVLVRLDPSSHRVTSVSIPRDLFIDVPGCGIRKINAAFNSDLVCDAAHGGMQLLVDTITRNLGVPINHVIEVQFPQFASLVDQLGGLRIEFPVPARDRYTGLAETAGCATLTGDQALSFVRSRHLEWLRRRSGTKTQGQTSAGWNASSSRSDSSPQPPSHASAPTRDHFSEHCLRTSPSTADLRPTTRCVTSQRCAATIRPSR